MTGVHIHIHLSFSCSELFSKAFGVETGACRIASARFNLQPPFNLQPKPHLKAWWLSSNARTFSLPGKELRKVQTFKGFFVFFRKPS